MSLLLLILGIGALSRLSLREFPDVDRPVVNIETRYRGASSDVVESRITQIIENEISGIEGVERLNSSSRDERSQINVEFSLDRDLDAAANDVRERLSRVSGRLPLEADPSQITKVDSGTDPIMFLNVGSTQRSVLELTDYMERYLVDQFSTLDGVANVRMNGARRYAMRVWLSRENLAARQLTVNDVENSLLRENVELPAGRLESTRARIHAADRHQPAHRRRFPQSRRGPRAGRVPGAPRRSGRGATGIRRRSQPLAFQRGDRSVDGDHSAVQGQYARDFERGEGAARRSPEDSAQGHLGRNQHRQRRVHRRLAEERGVRADARH